MKKQDKKKNVHWLKKEIHPIIVIVVSIIAVFIGAALFVLVVDLQRASSAVQKQYQDSKTLQILPNDSTSAKPPAS